MCIPQYFFNIQVLIFKLGNIKSNYNQVPLSRIFLYKALLQRNLFYPTKQFSQCVSLVKWFKCNKNIHTRIKQSYKSLSNSFSNLPYGICQLLIKSYFFNLNYLFNQFLHSSVLRIKYMQAVALKIFVKYTSNYDYEKFYLTPDLIFYRTKTVI